MWRCPRRASSLPQTCPHICRSVNQYHWATVFLFSVLTSSRQGSPELQVHEVNLLRNHPCTPEPCIRSGLSVERVLWMGDSNMMFLICHLSASPNVLALAPICPQGGLKFTCLITQKTFPMAIMYLSGEWIDNAVHRLIIIPALKVSVVDHRMEQFSAWCTVGRINLMIQKLNPYIKINLFGRSFWWLHLV